MKKNLSFLLAAVLICALFTAGAFSLTSEGSNQVATESSASVIILQINNPQMTVDGAAKYIDENGTAPVIQNGRSMLPVRAIVEAMGGIVEWEGATGTVTMTHGSDTVTLIIGSDTAILNGNTETLDVAPMLINGRTMLPIRFIAECFGYDVGWDGTEAVVTLTTSGRTSSGTAEASTVYFTADITAESLMAVYNALEANPTGNIAVKITTGEPPNSNYLRPELIKDLVQMLDGTLVESNTAYGGRRASNAMHLQVAEDHGFTKIAAFDLQDADGEISLPVVGGEILTENLVGITFPDYDYYVVLSHFKGHGMAGYGGAIKNASIGIASSAGKSLIHTGGTRRTGFMGDQTNFLMAMAESTKSVSDYLDGNILYINVMNRLSVDCDCVGNPTEPDMHDIGILASFDPVALDQACVDIVAAASDGASLMERINSRNGTLTIDHAEAIGLGSKQYTLVSIDG